MTDLDRLIEISEAYAFDSTYKEEYDTLKAKIEGKIDEGIQQEKADLLSILDMKDEEVAKLKEELRLCIKANDILLSGESEAWTHYKQLKSTLDEIKTFMESDLDEEFVQSWHVRKELKTILAKHEDKK